MTPDQLEPTLERHAKLLWWMTDQARLAFIAVLRADMIQQIELEAVAREMELAS
jgi:hypothetical protein